MARPVVAGTTVPPVYASDRRVATTPVWGVTATVVPGLCPATGVLPVRLAAASRTPFPAKAARPRPTYGTSRRRAAVPPGLALRGAAFRRVSFGAKTPAAVVATGPKQGTATPVAVPTRPEATTVAPATATGLPATGPVLARPVRVTGGVGRVAHSLVAQTRPLVQADGPRPTRPRPVVHLAVEAATPTLPRPTRLAVGTGHVVSRTFFLARHWHERRGRTHDYGAAPEKRRPLNVRRASLPCYPVSLRAAACKKAVYLPSFFRKIILVLVPRTRRPAGRPTVLPVAAPANRLGPPTGRKVAHGRAGNVEGLDKEAEGAAFEVEAAVGVALATDPSAGDKTRPAFPLTAMALGRLRLPTRPARVAPPYDAVPRRTLAARPGHAGLAKDARPRAARLPRPTVLPVVVLGLGTPTRHLAPGGAGRTVGPYLGRVPHTSEEGTAFRPRGRAVRVPRPDVACRPPVRPIRPDRRLGRTVPIGHVRDTVQNDDTLGPRAPREVVVACRPAPSTASRVPVAAPLGPHATARVQGPATLARGLARPAGT